MSLVVLVRKCVHGTYRAKPKFSFSVFGVIEFPLKMGAGGAGSMLSLLPPFCNAGARFFGESPFF